MHNELVQKVDKTMASVNHIYTLGWTLAYIKYPLALIKNRSWIEIAAGDVSLAANMVIKQIKRRPNAPLELASEREGKKSQVTDGEEERRVAATDGQANDLLRPPWRRIAAEENLQCWLGSAHVPWRDLYDLVLCHQIHLFEQPTVQHNWTSDNKSSAHVSSVKWRGRLDTRFCISYILPNEGEDYQCMFYCHELRSCRASDRILMMGWLPALPRIQGWCCRCTCGRGERSRRRTRWVRSRGGPSRSRRRGGHRARWKGTRAHGQPPVAPELQLQGKPSAYGHGRNAESFKPWGRLTVPGATAGVVLLKCRRLRACRADQEALKQA